MTIETYRNVVERQYFMPARDLMDILPGKALYVYIANLTAMPVNLPKFMIWYQRLMACRASYTQATRIHAQL